VRIALILAKELESSYLGNCFFQAVNDYIPLFAELALQVLDDTVFVACRLSEASYATAMLDLWETSGARR
jgi:hypothetical protein